jgi:hypothetical protein
VALRPSARQLDTFLARFRPVGAKHDIVLNQLLRAATCKFVGIAQNTGVRGRNSE